MFTNWLTGTSSGSAGGNAASEHNVSANATQALTAASMGGVMATRPDVVLEVGPAPGSVRFVAHSLVLGMHSGYLRSAIRLDENVQHAAATAASSDLLLYLGNVTAEQFAPLLTYMYTGYLDLNVDNIFGVLLATHVLHMPRALEICRSYLARAQTESYLGSGLSSVPGSVPNTATSAPPTNASSSKIIRPIPSKATLPNFGFLPLTHQLPLPLATSTSTAASSVAESFKHLPRSYGTPTPTPTSPRHTNERARHEERSDEIEVTRTPSAPSAQHEDDDEDEDEEVFIDSNTETDVDCAISVTSRTSLKQHAERDIEVTLEPQKVVARNERPKDTPRRDAHRTAPPTSTKGSAPNKRDKRKHARHKTHSGSTSGLQVAKAPIPASQLDASEASKVIIDVASCDGPVRFRRILNTAYGHKPEDYAVMPERTQQSVSLSFHQQMAKTISQQRQLAHANEESENSESSGGGGGVGGSGAAGGGSGKQSGAGKSGANEIYVCVYCKHTFKSQYCYQKHAKRHLNPLSLSCAPAQAAAATSGALGTGAGEREKRAGAAAAKHSATQAESGGAAVYGRVPLPIGASKQTATELLRREVRPLDMNVQYYPCKTCGSKFPSYYFVHKHRKLCHADEEADNAAGPGAAAGGNGSGSGQGANDNDEKSPERKAD